MGSAESAVRVAMRLMQKFAPAVTSPPQPQSDWALFLDFDGTLLDIAPRPDEIEIPKSLPGMLLGASAWLEGALAIVSGRALSQIDRFLDPLRLPGGGEHGATVRLPDGTLETAGPETIVPIAWRNEILRVTNAWGGVLVEEKPYGITVHYREAPYRADDILALLVDIAGGDPRFEILASRMAYEVRSRAITKARVVNELMGYAPFSGRVPVFVGDDVTDHDGFRAVVARGGLALDVGEIFGGEPAAVREWLRSFAANQD